MEVDQSYELVRIDTDADPLKEHPQNPKVGHEGAIEESIEHNGWYGAIVVQKSTGYILVGNHRYRVAKKQGAREIPVIFRDIDDETALRILLVDNKSAEMGYFDEELLTAALDGLQSLDGTGYGDALNPLEQKIEEERANGSGGAADSADAGAAATADADDPLPGPDDIPDDVYTPQFGVMLVCESEQQQSMIYEHMRGAIDLGLDEELWENVKLRVVAV